MVSSMRVMRRLIESALVLILVGACGQAGSLGAASTTSASTTAQQIHLANADADQKLQAGSGYVLTAASSSETAGVTMSAGDAESLAQRYGLGSLFAPRQALLAHVENAAVHPPVSGLYWVVDLSPSQPFPQPGGNLVASPKAGTTTSSAHLETAFVVFINTQTNAFELAVAG
jgi:hypothetical protein